MARSKADIIGEMVDSGLFSDEEIRQEVAKHSGPGLIKRGWEALAWPEQKSREGLKMLDAMVPTPETQGKPGAIEAGLRSLYPPVFSNVQPGVIEDVARGAPKVASETLAEAAPGFISRGAILTAGGAKLAAGLAPAAKAVLRSIGNQGEELSGIAPKTAGALEAAYKDSSLLFAKGKKAASGAYEAAKDELNAARDTYRATGISENTVSMGKIRDVLKGKYQPSDILDTANKFVSGGGEMQPAEALKVRKAIDVLIKSKGNVPDELYEMRKFYDGIAKSSENISEADTVFRRGSQAQALRSLFPQNKYGGTSAFKLGIMTALDNMGLPGKLALPALSPLVQGIAATGAGVAARQVLSPLTSNGLTASAIAPIIEALRRRRENAQ